MDRRRFFREGLRELLRPVSRAVEPIHRVAEELGKLEPDVPPPPPLPPPAGVVAYQPPAAAPAPCEAPSVSPPAAWLRPPGALADDERFTGACSRCGKCAEVCPAQCIKIDETRSIANGAPYIDPDAMPCILCTGLECMHTCPSGALLPTPLQDIDMGTARWHEPLCLRTHGEPCTMCVDHCPVGGVALELVDNRIVVHEDGCVGCGVCQNNCPTDPKSITVTPRTLRDAAGGAGRSPDVA
jgi:MauM/NapG family ferredoxin protein